MIDWLGMNNIVEHELFCDRVREHANNIICVDSPANKFFNSASKFLFFEQELVRKLHDRDFENTSFLYSFIATVLFEKLFEYSCSLIFGKSSLDRNCPVCLVAVGEFGQNESFIHSKIKLLIFSENDWVFKNYADKLLDVMQLDQIKFLSNKISFENTTIKSFFEKLKNSANDCCDCLSARFLSGSVNLYRKFDKIFNKVYLKSVKNFSNFLQEFFELNQNLECRYGDTFLLKEPNVIKGIGGFKEAQQLLRIMPAFASVFGIEMTQHELKLKAAYSVLKKLRDALLIISGRDSEKLYVDRQSDIAKLMRYKSPALMLNDFYDNAKVVREIFLITKANFEEITYSLPQSNVEYFDGFYSQNGFIYHKNAKIFDKKPIRILNVFRYATQFNYKLSPALLELISVKIKEINFNENSGFIKIFIDILSDSGQVYNHFKYQYFCEIFSKIFKEFETAFVKQLSSNLQTYTLGMHCVQSIKWLDYLFDKNIPSKFSILQNILKKIKDYKILYISLLFHDIGQIYQSLNHNIKSAEIIERVIKLFDLNPKQEDILLFLIKEHGLIPKTFDKNDFELAAKKLANAIENEENLNYLYIHTFCDLSATNNLLWSDSSNATYAEIYSKTLEIIKAKNASTSTNYNEKLLNKLSTIEQDENWLHLANQHINLTNFSNLATLPLSKIKYYIDCIIKFDSTNSTLVDWLDDKELGICYLIVTTKKEDSLIRRVCGCLMQLNVSISAINAVKRLDGLVVLFIYFKNVLNKKNFHKYSNLIKNAVNSNCDSFEPTDKLKIYKTQNKTLSSITLYLDSAKCVVVLDAAGNDRIGLLFDITKIIDEQNFEIIFADVKTENFIVIDRFWLKPKNLSASIPSLRTALDDLF